MLIKVFEKLLFFSPNIKLFIGGNGPEYANIKKYIYGNNLENQTFLLGKLSREEVRIEMQKCDIFVLSSKVETFGVVLIEAMACGKPVVSTKSGGPESIIIKPELGELVENTEDALLAGLQKVIAKLSKYDSEEIREYVVQSFSAVAVCKKLTDIYVSILKK